MINENFIYIESYGCSANKNNSEIIAGILKHNKFEITNNEKIAEIIIINSCIVKGKTESKIKRRIQDLSREFPNKIMIVCGCMAETDFNSLKKINPHLLFLGLHHIKDIAKLIKDKSENKLSKSKQEGYMLKQEEEKILLPKIPSNKLISITQISEGCLGNCSYCKTRLAKGSLFSYPSEKIIKSIESDLSNGAKEIWITSQDNASYGLDNSISNLPRLLKKIIELRHNFKIRIGMMNPNHLYPILNEMIEIYKSPKIYKFLHIPMQSASNEVLADMNRKYKVEEAEKIIKKFRKEFPDISIATDIITGYPTETNENHKQNIEFIKKFSPDVLNLSKFSSHKGTKAGELKTLNKDIVSKRAGELMELHRKTAYENKQKFLKKKVRVLVNDKTKMQDVYESRDENYNIILVNSKENILGKNILVEIIQTGVHHMIGRIT
jgi:MiaB-like tRNA modifying enzyme